MTRTKRADQPTQAVAPPVARTAPRAATQHSALSTQHSNARLRALLRASPLVAPELRAHWLRVLPHLSAEQRAELAVLLQPDAAQPALPSRADARRP